MSLEMVYVVDQAEFAMPVRDHEMFLRLGQMYPRECEAVFGVDEPGALSLKEPHSAVSRMELLAALDRLLDAFKEHPELNPRRYVFDFDIIRGVPVAGDDEVNSVKLPGKEGYYHLLGGVGQCVLRKTEAGPGIFPIYKEPVDVRD